jgi:hypothetical protein
VVGNQSRAARAIRLLSSVPALPQSQLGRRDREFRHGSGSISETTGRCSRRCWRFLFPLRFRRWSRSLFRNDNRRDVLQCMSPVVLRILAKSMAVRGPVGSLGPRWKHIFTLRSRHILITMPGGFTPCSICDRAHSRNAGQDAPEAEAAQDTVGNADNEHEGSSPSPKSGLQAYAAVAAHAVSGWPSTVHVFARPSRPLNNFVFKIWASERSRSLSSKVRSLQGVSRQ